MGRSGRALGVALVLAVAGCGGDGSSAAPDPTTTMASTTAAAPTGANEALDVSVVEAPAGIAGAAAFVQDLRCGDAERNLVDLALPEPIAEGGAEAADMPLVISLHGGGFVIGDKADLWVGLEVPVVEDLLAEGIAVASMSYSLLAEEDPDGVIKPLEDAARCLQFLRYHGPATFGIDPDRIALRGSSAGAGIALWLALHDDLADPAADDPLRRMSTKPVAVAARVTQATYDLTRWGPDVFSDYPEVVGGRDLVELSESFGLGQRLLSFYGIDDPARLDDPDIEAYRADVDLLGLMDQDDPPAWVDNTYVPDVAPTDIQVLFHHSHHARALEEQAGTVGYDATVAWGFEAEVEIGEVAYLAAALAPQ